MKKALVIATILLIVVLIGAYVWMKGGVQKHTTAVPNVEYVYITNIATKEDVATVTVAHVTYFEGDEAVLSATHEVTCEKEIETCVPSLAKGYYVRQSGAPQDSFQLASDATIQLKNKEQAELNDLASYLTDNKTEPIFTIAVSDKKITAITEVNHL